MRALLPLAAATSALLLAACGEGGAKQEPAAKAPPPKVVVEAPAADAAAADPAAAGAPGAVRGVVRFVGEPPPRRPLAFGSTAGCDHGGGEPLSEDLIVTDGMLENCIVWIAKGLEGYTAPPPPSAPHVLDQHGCVYAPHVSAIRAGQPVQVQNSDPTTHNVHVYSRYGGSNKTQPPKGQPIELAFEKPEPPLRIGCDIHPWMRSWLGVFDHPFFAVTGPDGAFALEGLPPGKYRLDVWHEKLGKQQHALEVPAGGAVRLELFYEE